MYYAKAQGKTLVELKLSVKKIYEELCGVGEEVTNVSVERTRKPVKVVEVEEETEEYEEVESPYAKTPSSIDRSTVINNEVDSEGIPWDDRIHASSKAIVKDGTWRTKRGVDDETLYHVKAELKARVGNAVVEAPVVPAYEAPVTPAYVAPVVEAPVVAPMTPPQPTIQAANGHTLASFQQNFPLILANLITIGKVTQEYVQSLQQYFGVSQIWNLNDAQKAEMFESFVQYGFVQRVG